MDWQLTCRVCLETGDMVSLFDWDDNNEQLGDKYAYCCGVEVEKDDALPTLICLNCVDRLTFSYEFKKQCLSSNETLKECLEEFTKSSAAVSAGTSSKVVETETITIKQENGLLLQYELPVEHDPSTQWNRTYSKGSNSESGIITKAPGPRKRGRPRKYPNEHGQIELSKYTKRKPVTPKKEPVALTTLLESGALELKQEPDEERDEALDEAGIDFDDDPDFNPDGEMKFEDDNEIQEETPRKRGRPRKDKKMKRQPKTEDDDGEDVLLQETILAFSEPIPDDVLNPRPKKKAKGEKKKYVYEKIHICETCGASFTSNAVLQAHIRRHLGIKPFVCSVCGYSCVLNMELRRHMLRHTGQRPYKCRICDRRFGDFGSRQKHESICGYRSDMMQNLKRHIMTHTDQKPFQCQWCPKAYREKGDLKKHERLHLGLRPYQCTLCGKSFTYSYVLSNHMLTHTGEKKFSCGPCNKKFTKAHHLKYHNKVHHKELYVQQQLEAEAKKMRQQMNASGVLAGQIVDGTIQLVTTTPDGDITTELQVLEAEQAADDPGQRDETDDAVHHMQGVVMDTDYCIQEVEDVKQII